MLTDQQTTGEAADETLLDGDADVQIDRPSSGEQTALSGTTTASGGSGIIARLKRNGSTTVEVTGNKPDKLTTRRAAEIALLNVRQYLREELRRRFDQAALPYLSDSEEITLLRPLASLHGDLLARALLDQREQMRTSGMLNIPLDTDTLDGALEDLLVEKGILERIEELA